MTTCAYCTGRADFVAEGIPTCDGCADVRVRRRADRLAPPPPPLRPRTRPTQTEKPVPSQPYVSRNVNDRVSAGAIEARMGNVRNPDVAAGTLVCLLAGCDSCGAKAGEFCDPPWTIHVPRNKAAVQRFRDGLTGRG